VDLIEAHKWFQLGAEAHHRQAGEELFRVDAELSGRDVLEATRRLNRFKASISTKK